MSARQRPRMVSIVVSDNGNSRRQQCVRTAARPAYAGNRESLSTPEKREGPPRTLIPDRSASVSHVFQAQGIPSSGPPRSRRAHGRPSTINSRRSGPGSLGAGGREGAQIYQWPTWPHCRLSNQPIWILTGRDRHWERKMDEVTIENFRCFRERQTARLAPLTLLVGENSTGKTSLMAMVRILWHAVFRGQQHPSFKDEPFDLGSFREVVHQSEKNGGSDQEFSAGFTVGDCKSDLKFRKGNVGTEVCRLRVENAAASATWTCSLEGHVTVEAETATGIWHFDADLPDDPNLKLPLFTDQGIWGLLSFWRYLGDNPQPARSASPFTNQDSDELRSLARELYGVIVNRYDIDLIFEPPVATAPVRSRPRRTYHHGPGVLDPEGAGVPEHLAALANSDAEQWKTLKSAIESFGRRAGVFDGIRIRPLGDDASSDPFQIQVIQNAGNNKGQWRNLIDVGYGVEPDSSCDL